MNKSEKIVLFILLGFASTLGVMNLLMVGPMKNRINDLEEKLLKADSDLTTFIDNASIDESQVKKVVDDSVKSFYQQQKILELGGKENYDSWQKTYESSLYKDFMTKKIKADADYMKQYVLGTMPTNEIQQSMNMPLTTNSINSLSTASGTVDTTKYTSGTLALTGQGALNGMLKQDRKQITFITFLNPTSDAAKDFSAKNIVSNIRMGQNGDMVGAGIGYFGSNQKSSQFSQALECVYNVAKDKYRNVLNLLLSSQNLDSALAGVDAAKVKSCIEDGQYSGLVQSQSAYITKNYNFDGSVMSILMNNETKKYFLIKGVQEVETYQSLINELLKK